MGEPLLERMRLLHEVVRWSDRIHWTQFHERGGKAAAVWSPAVNCWIDCVLEWPWCQLSTEMANLRELLGGT
jgi:hypothetical protein